MIQTISMEYPILALVLWVAARVENLAKRLKKVEVLVNVHGENAKELYGWVIESAGHPVEVKSAPQRTEQNI